MPVSTEHKIKAVHAYVEGFSSGDTEAIVALYSDDATVEDPVGTPLKIGIDAIREFYTTSMASGAKLELAGEPRCAGEYVAFAFAVKLHFNNQDSVIEVIDTFRFNEDGKVSEMRAYWGPENMKAG